MTVPDRRVRMSNDGFRSFPTGMPVRTVTIGFEDRPGTDDSILIAIDQVTMGYPVRAFCVLIGGSIISNPKVYSDMTFESGFIRINIPEVTGEQSNYSGWLIVDTIPQDPRNPSSHGVDDYSSNDI